MNNEALDVTIDVLVLTRFSKKVVAKAEKAVTLGRRESSAKMFRTPLSLAMISLHATKSNQTSCSTTLRPLLLDSTRASVHDRPCD